MYLATLILESPDASGDSRFKVAGYIPHMSCTMCWFLHPKMKNKLTDLFSTLTSLIINTRLEKIPNQENLERKNLTDEEKFILDSNQEMSERKDLIVQSITSGKSKLLKSISEEFDLDLSFQFSRISFPKLQLATKVPEQPKSKFRHNFWRTISRLLN